MDINLKKKIYFYHSQIGESASSTGEITFDHFKICHTWFSTNRNYFNYNLSSNFYWALLI